MQVNASESSARVYSKDNYFKATDDTDKDAQGYKYLDKELMDLKTILDLYFYKSKDFYKKSAEV